MIDIRKLKELVRLMVVNDLTELDLRDSEEQVTLRRPSQLDAPVLVQPESNGMPPGSSAPAQAPAPARAPTQPSDRSSETSDDDHDSGVHAIESPMVGTFYASPNPDAPSFIRVGDSVGPDTVICLVEAMKIFNEIKAECSGKVEKILVENGESVEFGQSLVLVRPG